MLIIYTINQAKPKEVNNIVDLFSETCIWGSIHDKKEN